LVWPVFLTFLCILGSIFFGIATATEAGGVGALVVLIVAVLVYGVRGKTIYKAMVQTVTINAQILIILVGAGFFSYIVGSSSLGRQLGEAVAAVGNPILVVILIQFVLLILGCFIDGMTIMFITIPIFMPMIRALGLSPLWFAVLFEINMEIALITPPMGINFFLVRNVFKIAAGELFWGVLPYLVMLVIFLFVILAFPPLSLWLPGLMMGR
jgi:tripartite ATP-independent transporter DctM subunit